MQTCLEAKWSTLPLIFTPALVPTDPNSMSSARSYQIVLLGARHAATYSQQIKSNHISALKLQPFFFHLGPLGNNHLVIHLSLSL